MDALYSITLAGHIFIPYFSTVVQRLYDPLPITIDLLFSFIQMVYSGMSEGITMSSLNMNTHQPHIAAIIPTYNEERNVAGVLRTLHASDLLDEIIIVDDGSVDQTVEIIRKFSTTDRRIQLIKHERNQGKGQAIFTGWAATTAPYLLLLDADLHDLTPDHIVALMAPVIDHQADMTLGLFWGGHINTDFSSWSMPFLTGQRGLRSEILKHISRDAAAGYGFEVALTVAASQHGYHKHIVPLKGVWHPPSEFHRGGLNGLIWRFRMYGQIIRGWVLATRQRYPKVKAFFSTILKP
jgi:glycosyltransferase involved in cell wall biosynthesis